MTVRAYIGLGSNLAEPTRQIQQAIDALAVLPLSKLVARSALYRSAALSSPELSHADDNEPQADYLNAVAAIDTALAAHALLALLLQIEQTQGRVRSGQRWAARTLDLDLLLFGDLTLSTAELTLPHYALTERAFVVLPLHEIAAELRLPDGTEIAALAALLDNGSVLRLTAG